MSRNPTPTRPAHPPSFGSIQAMASDCVTSAASSVAEECVAATLRCIGYDSQQADADARSKEYMDVGHIKATLVPVACHIMQTAADEAVADDKHMEEFPPPMRLTDVYCRAFAKWMEWFPIVLTDPRFVEINARYTRALLIKEFFWIIPEMQAPPPPSDLSCLTPLSMLDLQLPNESPIVSDSFLVCTEEMNK
jgi:hypothetical protein